MAMLLVNWVMVASLYDLATIVCYFTNWGLLVTTAWVALSIRCARDTQAYTKRPGLLALHHITFEIAVIMNLVIMVVYWPILHETVIKWCYERGEMGKVAHNHFVHIFPFFAVVLNFLFTDVVISGVHTKAILPIAVTYGYKNYQATIQMGEPVYWFLDWEDHWSFIIYGAITVGAMGVFYLLSLMTFNFKRVNVKRRKSTTSDKLKYIN